jgi:hypothetical protein
MKDWMWTARRELRSVGWPGMAGLALIVCSIAIFVSMLLPMSTRLAEAKSDVDALRAKLRAAPSAQGASASGDRLTNFYAFFPPLSSTPEWLQRIFGLAEAQGLRLEAGEYKLTRERDLQLSRYELNLPVRGGYAQIREFVGQVLNEVPASSLDELSMKRDDPSSAAVEARIKLTLYLGGEKSP